MAISNIIGQKFNKLIVLNATDKRDGHNCILFQCLCECGNITETTRYRLTSGQCKSCGCLFFEKWQSNINSGKKYYNDKTKKLSLKNSFNRLFISYKYTAKRRKLKFSLTKKQFLKLVTSNCHYSGCLPKQKLRSSKYAPIFYYNGIDRKDNNEGYTLSNSITCCKQCNFAKHNMSYKDFITYLNNLVSYRNTLKIKKP